RDQGEALVDKATMINVHGQGYYGALGEGVQTVMASFNSWNDRSGGVDYGKMHGNKALLTGALKEKMGFDGFVVSDWNGIAQIPGCRN
ncbi:glycoside hydrolase family 3 protein, partial [Mycobacterium tuberculosis]